MIAGDPPGRRIIVCRSASALDRGSWWGEDAARPLSRRGRKQAERAGRFLAGQGPRSFRVLSGPTLRERETAMHLAGAVGPASVEVRSLEAVTLQGLDEVLADAGDERLVLVLREPIASGLVALLCDSPGVELRAGAFAELRTGLPIRPGCATLRTLVTPDVLRGREVPSRPAAVAIRARAATT